jgi:hypothetical protein
VFYCCLLDKTYIEEKYMAIWLYLHINRCIRYGYLQGCIWNVDIWDIVVYFIVLHIICLFQLWIMLSNVKFYTISKCTLQNCTWVMQMLNCALVHMLCRISRCKVLYCLLMRGAILFAGARCYIVCWCEVLYCLLVRSAILFADAMCYIVC